MVPGNAGRGFSAGVWAWCMPDDASAGGSGGSAGISANLSQLSRSAAPRGVFNPDHSSHFCHDPAGFAKPPRHLRRSCVPLARVGLKSHSMQSKSAQSADCASSFRFDSALHVPGKITEREGRLQICRPFRSPPKGDFDCIDPEFIPGRCVGTNGRLQITKQPAHCIPEFASGNEINDQGLNPARACVGL